MIIVAKWMLVIYLLNFDGSVQRVESTPYATHQACLSELSLVGEKVSYESFYVTCMSIENFLRRHPKN